jgi:hypothetical protein
MVNIDPYYQRIIIDDERRSINYYAQEIGFCKWMLERLTEEKDDTLRQWWTYFLTLAEAELDNANERLGKFRQELIDYEQQQSELRAV